MAKADNRDDFSKPVIETLAKRVNYRCSNPGCRVPTSGPHSDPNKAVNVGVAAHITAASADGPRYDRNLTTDQRKSISNGIWLCQTCGKLVDNDEVTYPTALLQGWKDLAEDRARQEIGGETSPQPLPGRPTVRCVTEDWRVWLKSPDSGGVVFLDGWVAGDIRFSCNLRLRQDGGEKVQLHRHRVEFRRGDTVLHTDNLAFHAREIVLPPREWFTFKISRGLHGPEGAQAYTAADSIWFVVETVGDNDLFEWQIATPTAPGA